MAALGLWALPIPTFVKCALVVPSACVAFVVTAGLLSVPWQRAITPGRFPRDVGHPVYFGRRLYGLCWTTVFYVTPLYAFCLAVPALKALLFRLFGYRGPLGFTIYPDSWIRDLPLLTLGNGAYVANKATLGTNIALANGTIPVDRITLGTNAMVGHLSMIAPGVVIDDQAEVGVGCAIGIRIRIGKGARIQPTCALNHRAEIGIGAVVGSMSYVGVGAVVGDGVSIAPATLVAEKTQVLNGDHAGALVSSLTSRQLLRNAMHGLAGENDVAFPVGSLAEVSV